MSESLWLTILFRAERPKFWQKQLFLPGSIVHHHRVPGGASDAIVVLEKPQVTPRGGEVIEQLPRRETVGRVIVSTETPHVSQR